MGVSTAAAIRAQSSSPREVTDDGPWEYQCLYSGRITAEPCEASGCPGRHARRRPASEWEPVPATTEGEKRDD